MNEKERIEEVFDHWYYDDFSITNQKRCLGPEQFLHQFNDYLKWNHLVMAMLNADKKDLPIYKILDAGCGNGNLIRKMIELGANPSNCFGIDISEKALEFAKFNSPEKVQFKKGFIDNTEFSDESMDVIFSMGVLIHIIDNEYIKKIADEFYRVLKPGGHVFLLVSDENTLWGDMIKHTTRNFNFKEGELQGLFSKFSCEQVINTYMDTYPEGTVRSSILSAMENGAYYSWNKLVVLKKA